MPVLVFAAVATGGAAVVGGAALGVIGITGVSTLTATAVGAGLISGGVTALQGGDAGDVLKSAVVGGVTTYAGGVIGAKVASSVTAAAAPSFPELAKVMGNVAGAMAAGGTSASLTALAYNQDPIKALVQGGLTAGLSAGVMQGVTAITGKSSTFNQMPEPAKRAVNSAIAAGALGQNPSEAAVNELLQTVGERMGREFKDYTKQLQDSYNKTKTAADTVNTNIQQQQALADEYNSALEKHNSAVISAQNKVAEYDTAVADYNAKKAKYDGWSGSGTNPFLADVNAAAEKANKIAAEANKLSEPLKGSAENLANIKTRFDNTTREYQSIYDTYAATQTKLNADTELFAKTEAENLDVVKKYYNDLADIKTTFKDELGRDARTNELASIFKTEDYDSTARDYVSQKKWESMTPEEQYQAKLDFLQSSTADLSGTTLPVKMFTSVPKDIASSPDLAPRAGEVAGEIRPVLMEDGTYAYERTISGVTQDGRDYSYTASYDPQSTGPKATYSVVGGVSADLPSGDVLPEVNVQASATRPVFDTADSTAGVPISQRNVYNQALNTAVQSRLALGQAKSNLSTAQAKLSSAQASGDAKAVAAAQAEISDASNQVALTEAAEKEDVARLQEVTVEGQREAQARLTRAQRLMGEPPANIMGMGGGSGQMVNIDPSFAIIGGEQATVPEWKMPGLKDRFLKASLAPTAGYQSIFDPIKATEDTISPEEPTEEPSMYSPFSSFEPPTAATSMAQDPYAYAMQPPPSSTMTPDPLAQNAPGQPSYYNYGNPNPLQTFTQSPFYQTPTAQIQTLARGGLAHFARGGEVNPFAALFAAVGGPSKVPHKGSHYVQGAGGGQDDLIDARLADGEYVFDADIVAALGDGSNKEGAKRLDKMREAIRAHKRSAPNDKIPPKAKSPLAYFKEAK